MGKKIRAASDVSQASQPEESEAIQAKKQNAKLLEKALKSCTASVLASIDAKQAASAAKALQDFQKKRFAESKGLLDSEQTHVTLSFTMTAVPNKPSHRPQLIKLPHPFYSAEESTRVCVFVKDPAREFKDQIQDLDIPCIAKVIGFDKLKRNFKQYKDKRTLLKDYDAFLSDLRVYKMLPECLGNEFYTHKKYPVPLKVHGFTNKELQKQLNQAAVSSQFMQGNGPNYSVKIGKTSQKASEIGLNAQQALAQALAYLSCHEQDRLGLEQVAQVSLKIGDSPELPIFSQLSAEDIAAYTA